MKTLINILKNGQIKLIDVPPPQLHDGFIMVKNHYSLISAGTESSTIKASQKGYIGKAKSRPDQFKKVIDNLKNQGPINTYRNVMKKLEAYSPLGYSSAGRVIDVGQGVDEFSVGDLVACSGVGYANHAEIVTVPKNLCVKLNKNSNLKNASYNALGGIAMQAIRQADLKLGETCAVIGLGLVGQLTCLLLKANGINVVGIDINNFAVNFSDGYSVDLALNRSDDSIKNKILNFTHSIGADCVIIAASTNSLDPVNFAGAICRQKGKVIILGDVPTGFDREYYYRKELTLKMSCSYGPGRYDTSYERKGIDYPLGYVRWTEKRNMEAFQRLLDQKKIDINNLTTQVFPLDKYKNAYDLIISDKKNYFGVVLKYDEEKTSLSSNIQLSKTKAVSKINLGMFGAGSYAQANILPHISQDQDIRKNVIITNNGTSSKKIGEKYEFEICSSDKNLIYKNDEINTVFILTRHDSHSEFIINSLKNNKNVFCEKPLCINEEDLSEIIENIYDNKILIGYNRRFSEIAKKIKSQVDLSPMMMLCRINAGPVALDSWLIDSEVGGGRIVGEVCHFVDFFTFLCGSLPYSVSAKKMSDDVGKQTNVSITINFLNGSNGSILFTSSGSDKLSKEYYEVHQNGVSFLIDNFKELIIHKNNKTESLKKLFQDKGQKRMIESFFENIMSDEDNLISIDEIIAVSKTTFAIEKSIKLDGENIVL